MTHDELVLWAAAYELEPWGSTIEWLQTGVIASTIANCSFGSKGGYKPTDFTPPIGEPPKPMSPLDVRNRFKAYAEGFNNKGPDKP
jgi:hypothetical protein